MTVRVRFAPSPTGYLHIGGLRTALYNFLFAKHHNGCLILRIEDTDQSRLVENATEKLIEALSWAGIDFDEGPGIGGDLGPYVQSERLNIYREHAQKLIDSGSAYYAFDTAEEIKAMREKQQQAKLDPKYDRSSMKNQFTLGDEKTKQLIDSGETYVIRLNTPADTDIKFNDIIRGEVIVNSKDIDDQILLKSDGFPTYHLANVVDDYLMKITHVIRGEEWLPSTPKHILLYKAFGWELPKFAHLPLLLNTKKAKLSKRHGDVAVEDFRAKGYFKEAFVNFIALLGWNPSADREIYPLQELIESFNLEKVNKGGAVFDTKKLDWMNEQYLKLLPVSNLAELFSSILKEKSINDYNIEYLEKIIVLFRERVTFLKEIPDFAPYMFAEPTEYDEKYLKKHWKENTIELIMPLFDILKNADDFSHKNIHDITMQYVESKEIKLRDVIHPLRLMITGKSAGAGMFETMDVLGKDKCINRIEKFIKK